MKEFFKPSNEAEKHLFSIITTNKESNERKKALKKLRNLTNRNELPISTLQSEEIYEQVKGKPVYFKKFVRATVFVHTFHNVEYNYN